MSELDTRELSDSSAEAPVANGRADGIPVASSPFEFLRAADTFGVCDLDGACY